MSKKVVMAKFPGYVWLKLSVKDVDVFVNSTFYEYDYENKLFYRAENDGIELKVVEDNCVFDATKEQARKLKDETE